MVRLVSQRSFNGHQAGKCPSCSPSWTVERTRDNERGGKLETSSSDHDDGLPCLHPAWLTSRRWFARLNLSFTILYGVPMMPLLSPRLCGRYRFIRKERNNPSPGGWRPEGWRILLVDTIFKTNCHSLATVACLIVFLYIFHLFLFVISFLPLDLCVLFL